MPRVVLHSSKRPYRHVTEKGEEVWICMCGFSETYPICSGRHREFAREAEGKYFLYDQKGNLIQELTEEEVVRLKIKSSRSI
ncbi:MAG: hypothetical protein NZ920_02940 [Aigarchaeota archaeon]|nr:hypothetical protein [Aigarchaeota archaeon]MDW8092421.1 hypothetical protein [Nitrososphaerota archaeon]